MKKEKHLPENWEEMAYFERTQWFMENYAKDEIDAFGDLVYDTEHMPDDVLEAYKLVIESAREAKSQGIMFD